MTTILEAGQRKLAKVEPLLSDTGGQLRSGLARQILGVTARTRTTEQKQELSHEII